jgi:predicted O-methyltransferase YrrM
MSEPMIKQKLKFFITPEVYKYIVAHSVHEPHILWELRQATQKLRGKSMILTPEQGQFFKLLCGLLGPKRILEVGTYTGYGALCFALNSDEDAHIDTIDINPQWHEHALPFWQKAGMESKITQHHGDATDVLNTLDKEAYDLIFVDANKEETAAHYELAYTLCKPGGLIILDNTLMWGEVVNPNISKTMIRKLRLFNKQIHEDSRVDISILPFSDGMTLARKK